MLYFIPAWYQRDEWHENEQEWYRRRMHTEFDDTVKQIQLFHRSGAYPYMIMLLSCSPNLRHFLHRQGVYHAAYWSCFDAIQEIRRRKASLLSFHNLKWPPHTEFLYTPFVIVAMVNGKKYAQLDFGEDGNLIQIDMYDNGQHSRKNVYDDRGFVSSTIVYRDEKPYYHDYLMENGNRKLRYFYGDGHVEINPNCPNYLLIHEKKEHVMPFLRLSYDNMEQVIAEVLTSYLRLTGENDLFCVAMHDRHDELMKQVLQGRKMILSFFEDRYDLKKHPDMIELIERADYIIADSRENKKAIQDISDKELKIKNITPFDSRVDFGISQQLNVQKILVPVDGMEDTVFEQVIQSLGEYIGGNENAMVHLFTRRADFDRKEKLLKKARECLRLAGMDEDMAAMETEKSPAENDLEAGEKTQIRFFAEQCVDELSVSRCMREQRIIVDMRNTAEVYLRITAISMEIPQIVHTETQFVEHGRNGYVLKDIRRLPGVLAYYLESLTNWNEAAVCAYEIGKKYTTDVLLGEWKEVINCVGENQNIISGN